MKAIVAALFAALSAPAALAQDAVQIPFAPPIPSSYAVEEERTLTFTGDGFAQTSVVRARYSLEFRQRDGDTFTAVWTTDAAEWSGRPPENAPDPLRWVGVPLTLRLDESGDPTTIIDWDDVPRPASNGDGDRVTTMEDTPAEQAANFLALPLTMLQPCHDTNLPVGEPQRAEREYPAQRRSVRTSTELDTVDREAGTARIVFGRVDRLQGNPLGTLEGIDHVTTVRADCTIDLATGVVRNAVASTASGNEESMIEVRSTISIAPR